MIAAQEAVFLRLESVTYLESKNILLEGLDYCPRRMAVWFPKEPNSSTAIAFHSLPNGVNTLKQKNIKSTAGRLEFRTISGSYVTAAQTSCNDKLSTAKERIPAGCRSRCVQYLDLILNVTVTLYNNIVLLLFESVYTDP